MRKVPVFILAVAVIVSWSGLELNAQTAVTVERVVPNKILYSENEKAQAEVLLRKTAEEEISGKIVAYEIRGLDVRRKIAELPVTIEAAELKKDISFTWNVGPWMYGRETRVDFITDGKVISSASEFYQVADRWLRVNIIAGWKPAEGLPRGPGVFESYANHAMRFAWAPCDFSDMTPDADGWYSGQAMYGPFNIEEYKKDIEKSHAKGIKITTYAKYQFCGAPGFEFARQHPEWVLREKDGSFNTFSYLKRTDPISLAQPITEKQPLWQPRIVDFFYTGAVEYGAREIIASAKMFGWDGVFFDGAFNLYPGRSWDGEPSPHGENPNELSARNIRLCREIIRKEFPNCALWYNGIWGPRLNEPYEKEGGNMGGPQTQQACLEDPNSGLLVEKQGRQFIARPWQHWYEFYGDRRDETIQKFGSVMNSGWLWNYNIDRDQTPEELKASRSAWVASNHTAAIFAAFQIHPCLIDSYGFRPFMQFMTRYSWLIWDTDVRKIDEPEKLFTVKSARPLWWKKTAYTKDADKETLYLIHLLNKPTTEKPDWKVPEDPPAASDVEVTFYPPEGKTIEKVWALRPYEWGELNRTPVQKQLEIEKTDKGAKVKVPAFHYYTLVVFSLKK